jgi:hypothetical protein
MLGLCVRYGNKLLFLFNSSSRTKCTCKMWVCICIYRLMQTVEYLYEVFY